MDVRTSFVLGNAYAYVVKDDSYALPPVNGEETRVAKASRYYMYRLLETLRGGEEASSSVSLSELHHLHRGVAVAITDGFMNVVRISSRVQWYDLLALVVHAGIIARSCSRLGHPCVESVVYENLTELVQTYLERWIREKRIWNDLSRARRKRRISSGCLNKPKLNLKRVRISLET
jgi:hypothetical protein